MEQGAKLADSPRAVAQESDVVFTIVGYPRDVREVTLGAQRHARCRQGRRPSWST